MVTAVLEVHRGVDNLWKHCHSAEVKAYPNYGQYIPINYMKAFLHSLPYLWADKMYWDVDPNALPFAFIQPFVDEFNSKRTKVTIDYCRHCHYIIILTICFCIQILNVIHLILDESMSAWRPKTSKRGGLPHISHEPRKPVPLGTMLRNAVECLTGIFVHQDLVDTSTKQWEKEFLDPPTKSHLPKGENISYHTAEVLHQAKNSKVIKGGWVGGDAWFGSIESVVELHQVLGLYSTFIVKQNLNYFPMKVLHAILCARHGARPAGHWVIMKATIGGVDLYVMAYAWSSKGVAYMVSSCGKTVMHEKPYVSKFEDEYGNVQTKELARPTIAHMLYEFLPLIDEHNKARQNLLALEKCWLTKNC